MTAPPTPRLTAADVEITDKETPFEGYFRIDRYRLRHKMFEGGWSSEMVREVFERGHAVAVLPYDPVLDQLVLIEQFRPGAYAALASDWFGDDASPWLIECVAGIIEKGEDPEAVARREAMEETDCRVTDLMPVRHYLVSPGGTSESVFVYVGRTDASGAGGVFGITDEHENIRVFTLSPEDAFRMVDEGRIVNAMTIIALEWLRRSLDRVRDAWRTPAGD